MGLLFPVGANATIKSVDRRCISLEYTAESSVAWSFDGGLLAHNCGDSVFVWSSSAFDPSSWRIFYKAHFQVDEEEDFPNVAQVVWSPRGNRIALGFAPSNKYGLEVWDFDDRYGWPRACPSCRAQLSVFF